MARKPNVVEIHKDEKVASFIVPMSKEQFQKIINKYQKQNPFKAKLKADAFEKKLATLPSQEEVDNMVASAKAAQEGEE